jgi:hypothetical protein
MAKCRCTATMKVIAGVLTCPHRCPPLASLKAKKRVAKPERDRVPGFRTRDLFHAAAVRLGVPSQAWGSCSAKGAAESRARRAAR